MAAKAVSRQERIYRELLEEIQGATYQPGDYLPTVRDLAARFDTSITPVYLAVNRLAKEGYVSTAHGSGIQLVTRNVNEARVQRKPGIDFLGSTPNFRQEDSPGSSRMIVAASDWLLWGLSHSTEVRVSVSHFRYGNQEAFYEALTDCRFTDSKVVAFADPENVSQKALHLLNILHKSGKRVVHLGNREDLPHFDRVRGEFREGAYALTRHLLENGHRCLLRMNTRFSNWYELKKQEGFQAAIDDWNREAGDQAIGLTRSVESMTLQSDGTGEAEWDESLLREVLEFHPVTAILAPSDAAVLYLRYAAHILDREDLVITGYDATWSELADVHPHSVFIEKFGEALRIDEAPVSVDVHVPELGRKLAELAIDRALGNLPDEPRTVMCPQTLVIPGAE